MARRIQSYAVAAAAVASTVALVAAVPASPSQAYTPTRLSTAQYELTALSDISIDGLINDYFNGYGGYITSTDPYYSDLNPNDTTPIYVTGVSGVLYDITDNVIRTFLPSFNLQNYYFETAQVFGGGLPAVFYVGASEYIPGGGTVVAIIQNAVALAQSAAVSATSILPQVNLGPVTVGGSILSSLYFYGATPYALGAAATGPDYDYGTSGLSAILAYVSTSLAGGVPQGVAAVPVPRRAWPRSRRPARPARPSSRSRWPRAARRPTQRTRSNRLHPLLRRQRHRGKPQRRHLGRQRLTAMARSPGLPVRRLQRR